MNLDKYFKSFKEEILKNIECKLSCELDERSLLAEDEMINALRNEPSKQHSALLLKKLLDGEPVNVNPLVTIPNSQMTLYGIFEIYFDTEEELESYCQKHQLSMDFTFVLDYLNHVAGRSDVIRQTNRDGEIIFYAVIDEDGYGIYNAIRSIYKGTFVWEYNYGNIQKMYSAFRDRGIVFEDDVYAKISERNQQLIKKIRKNDKRTRI